MAYHRLSRDDDDEGPDIELSPAEPLTGAQQDEPLDDDALAAEMSRYLDKLAGAGVFSGAVLVARGGEPIFSGALRPGQRRAG